MHDPRKFPCEIEGCLRGEDKPFNRHWNLADHLRRVHHTEPGQYSQRSQQSQRNPQDLGGQDPTADIASTAYSSGTIRECVPDDSSGSSPRFLQREDEEGKEDKEGEAPPQEGPRQSRASWSTAKYSSAKVTLLTPESTVQESPAQGPPTPGFVEQLDPRWASLRQC